ncbi:hypothetical protein DNU06_04475 [Putridiphycobacter roseus]|uniref:Tail specific protease domain-containing protein n=1 Tax=Putridiphycobacter roseus TaxID=2219161 RepID=A0A2W1N043_9FLAO|nr:S41 family peptidase [Putridiphycobacter roseus]PZE17879.1 hypothetical protein DNU06_04475 [Putridiphycobacter roseus]
MKNFFALFLIVSFPLIGYVQEYRQLATLTEQVEDFNVFKTTLLECHIGIFDYNDSLSLYTNLGKLEKAIKSHPLTQIEQLSLYCKFTATIKCIHTRVYHKKMTNISLDASFLLPFRLCFFNNELIASEMYSSEQIAIDKNDKIISINGELVSDLKDSLYPFISSDGNNISYKNQLLKYNFLYYYFLYKQHENALSIEYIHKEETLTHDFILCPAKSIRIKKNKEKESIRFSIDTLRNLAILTLPEPLLGNKKYNEQLASIIETLNTLSVENLILDLRDNGGGKDQSYFSGFFIDTKIEFSRITKNPLHNATYKKYFIHKKHPQFVISKFLGRYFNANPNIKYIIPQQQYKGQLYVLINGKTGSAASNLASILNEWSNAILVGEESGGGYKSYNTGGGTIQLPNSKIRINIRTIKGINNVKDESESDSVTPNFIIKDAIYFDDNYDAQMDFIFNIILKQAISQ